ncbi:MAG: hypothetical protein ACRC42_05070 [Mycoplasma sp.]
MKSKEIIVTKKQQTTKKNSNVQVVEIHKFCDEQGIALRNKANDYAYVEGINNSVNKTSKYGVLPNVFYDSNVNFKDNVKKVTVVNPYNPRKFNDLPRQLSNLIQKKSQDALKEFDNEMNKIELISDKNLTIAKVNSLRLLTKAMIIEKDHHEQVYEKKCHIEMLKNIASLKEALIANNEQELITLLKVLKHEHEVELKNNDFDLERAKVKIQEKVEINKLKRQIIKNKINTLSSGKNVGGIKEFFFGNMPPYSLVKEIKNKKYLPQTIQFEDKIQDFTHLTKLVSEVKNDNLNENQKKLWNRFNKLIKMNIEENNFEDLSMNKMKELDVMAEKIMELKSNITNANNHEVVYVNKSEKVLNAKKGVLFISEPALLYAPATITKGSAKTTKTKNTNNSIVKAKNSNNNQPKKIDPSFARQSISKIKTESMGAIEKMEIYTPKFDSVFADKAIKRSIMDIKKIQGPSRSKFSHMNYQTIEYSNYEWGMSDEFMAKKMNRVSSEESYDTSEKMPRQHREWKFTAPQISFSNLNVFSEDARNARLLKKIQMQISHLASSPIVAKNKSVFKEEGINIEKVVNKTLSIIIDENFETTEEILNIIDEASLALEIYYELSHDETTFNRNVQKAQMLDDKLIRIICKQDSKIANMNANALINHQRSIENINTKYEMNLEDAKNKALLNKEYILEQEEANYAKEEETYLWNLSYHAKTSNKYLNDQFKVQNSMINKTISAIESFNRKNPEKQISLSGIPGKILPLQINSTARIDISLEKVGNTVYAISSNSEHKNELMSKVVNTDIPEQISKIYVLDKFRNVKDVKTRVALLNEVANSEYLKTLESNKQRVAREVEKAKNVLNNKIKEIDAIYDELDIVTASIDIMEASTADRKWVEAEFARAKKEKWKIRDAEEAYLLRQQKIENKQETLALLKQEKAMQRASAMNNAHNSSLESVDIRKSKSKVNINNIFKSKNNKIDIDEIIGKK